MILWNVHGCCKWLVNLFNRLLGSFRRSIFHGLGWRGRRSDRSYCCGGGASGGLFTSFLELLKA